MSSFQSVLHSFGHFIFRGRQQNVEQVRRPALVFILYILGKRDIEVTGFYIFFSQKENVATVLQYACLYSRLSQSLLQDVVYQVRVPNQWGFAWLVLAPCCHR